MRCVLRAAWCKCLRCGGGGNHYVCVSVWCQALKQRMDEDKQSLRQDLDRSSSYAARLETKAQQAATYVWRWRWLHPGVNCVLTPTRCSVAPLARYRHKSRDLEQALVVKDSQLQSAHSSLAQLKQLLQAQQEKQTMSSNSVCDCVDVWLCDYGGGHSQCGCGFCAHSYASACRSSSSTRSNAARPTMSPCATSWCVPRPTWPSSAAPCRR